MPLYECLKEGLIYPGLPTLKKGQIVSIDGIPQDGKGNSLLEEKYPAFRQAGGQAVISTPAEEPPKLAEWEEKAKLDPRNNAQIRRDIKEAYGSETTNRMKKAELLYIEDRERQLAGKDAIKD